MSDTGGGLLRHIRLRSATALVVASMIGAGIFTTTGFQAADLGHPGWIFLLWIIGGVLAFCGAMCFGELGASLPKAGAEYVYLREAYGRPMGFMTAFVALFAGFSAPIGAALEAFTRYLSHFIPILAEDPLIFGMMHLNNLVAIGFVWLLVALHGSGVRVGIRFNDGVTLFKVCGILIIIGAAVLVGDGDVENFRYVSADFTAMSISDKLTAFATGLIFVTFCYLGWNGAAYVASEMNEPQRDLPRSLLMGTGLVVALYLALNAVYLYGANTDALAGEVEVGLVAAKSLFGDMGVNFVALVLCVSILASASAMTVEGPRIYYAFGRDFPPLALLGRTISTGAPTAALVLQGVVTSLIIALGRVDQIIQYAGFTLSLFSSLAVSCVIALRIRRPDLPRPFKVWGYPFTPLLYIAVSCWTMVWAFRGRPVESTLALVTVAAGGVLFFALIGPGRARDGD